MNVDEVEELQGQIDDINDSSDTSQDLQEAQLESYEANSPQTRENSNIFNLFWKVVQLKDSTKVANINKLEIGDLGISVRECGRLRILGKLFHHEKFGNFFGDLGETTLSTSMSRDGWLGELFVSQKKQTTRQRRHSSWTNNKWKMFSQNNQEQQ